MALEYDDVTWERNKRGEKVIVGRGATSIVYAGRLRGQAVVIKAEALGVGEEAAWMNSARLHYGATCEHIVALHGIIVDREDGDVTHHLVMERLAGNMTALLLSPGGTHYGADMALRLNLLADVAGGLAYLHAASVIHGDVRPDNVLLTASTRRALPTAKLADFGSSVLRRTGTKTRGTLVYMDPALLDGTASIAAASDVYSFGVMAWQVLSGRALYDAELVAATAMDVEKLLKAHVCGPRGKRPPAAALVERGVPPAVVALVESCWAPAQAARPGMAEVQRTLEAAAATAAPAGGSGGGAVCGGAPAPTHVVPPTGSPATAPVPAVTPVATAVSVPASVPAPAPMAPVVSAPLLYRWEDKAELPLKGQSVSCLAVLPDCRLAGGNDRTVRLWNAAYCGEATAVLEGHGGPVQALAVLPGGRHLAVGVAAGVEGEKGEIVVWDTSVKQPTRCATINCGNGVMGLAVLLDGRLAAGCYDGKVRLVEVGADAGAVVATLIGHTEFVYALGVLPDGILASGSFDSTVRLWDVGAQSCVATLAGHTDKILSLAVLADGRLASASWDKSVRLWNVATRTCVGVLEDGIVGVAMPATALAALPDGRLAIGSAGCIIWLWDTRPTAAGATGAVAEADGNASPVVLYGHTEAVSALLPLPGGRLVSVSWDKTVRLWRLPKAA